MLNQFTVAGRVLEVGDLVYKDNGKPYQQVKIGVLRDVKLPKPIYDHLYITIYVQKLMEQVEKYIRRGQIITVTGHLQTGRYHYIDKNNKQQTASKMVLVGDKIYFDKMRDPLATEEEMAKYTEEEWNYIQENDYIDGDEPEERQEE